MTGTVLHGPWPGTWTRRQGSPPGPDYLAERKRLGIPPRPPGPIRRFKDPAQEAARQVAESRGRRHEFD